MKLLPSGYYLWVNVSVPDVDDIPEQWPTVRLRKRNSNHIIVGSGMKKARRYQYPLRYYVCSTVHKAIGETCLHVATQISSVDNDYRIWDKKMLLVILSRVRSLDDISFVGSKADTLAAIDEVLSQDDSLTKKQSEIMNALDVFTTGDRIVPALRPLTLHYADCSAPSVDCGFVYLAADFPDFSTWEKGNCCNLKKEMERLNTPAVGELSIGTKYILLAFIFGPHTDGASEDNTALRQNLLVRWINHRHPARTDCYGLQRLRSEYAILRDFVSSLNNDESWTLNLCFKLPDPSQV